MAPAPPATRRPPSRAINPPQAPPASTTGRVTRNRAVKELPSTDAQPSSSTLRTKPSGLLARGKEGLRTVSDKMKNKEKEPTRTKPPPLPEGTGTSAALQAFLRIRPPPADNNDQPDSRPYLEPQGEKEVLMRAPIDPSRPHLAPKAPLVYSFDHVYPPSTSQSSFFMTTTLPLVERLLQGENALMFAFGVSNSGKSYTISGGTGNEASERGLLPRSIDVIFNSIKGLESEAQLRCHALADIEFVDEAEHFSLFNHLPIGLEGRTEDSVKVDRNYSYAVFVSYAEVYNEKIFDLLDAVLPATGSAPPAANRPKVSSSFTRGSSAWAMSSMNLAAMANGGGGIIRRQALALKNDPEGSGKYIAGLKEVRVRTREEALAIFRAGQRARQVFGTLANRESSRSHGVFTTKIVKIHNGAPHDPESAQVSRLSIVDLAGSERTRNTGTTGDRLKEAGNINKSLMVLGQCLEVLRSNQQRLAASGPKKKLAMVPFRHSKLTEIFQNFFVGDGRAVMIVNVNPYDTGFDENSHVMRFSAIAREVQTTASNKVNFGGGLLRRQISTQFSALKNAVSGPMKVKVVVPVLPKEVQAGTDALRESDEFVMVEEELEVVEEDADEESEDERDALVDHLFEQLKELKEKLFESEMRNAAVESEVREEAAKEMQGTIQRMHDDFTKRLQEQVNAGQVKTDRKIDILSRTIATPAPTERRPLQQGQTFLASTPDIDMDTSIDESNDASFESAIDDSLIVGTLSPISRPRMSDVTDPFVARSPLRKEATDYDEDSGSETEEDGGESAEEDEIALGSEVEDSKPTARAEKRGSPVPPANNHGDVSVVSVATDDSEDVLGDLTMEGSEAIDDLTDEESQEDEDSESEEEDEEDISDSSFVESEEPDKSISSASPSPVRRQSKRRGTVSPKKRSTPASGPRTHSKVSAAALSQISITPQKNIKSPPLSERTRQDSVLEVSDEEMSSEPTKSIKKKRTLGKKIVMEDEMLRDDVAVRGAIIKRMTPKKVLR